MNAIKLVDAIRSVNNKHIKEMKSGNKVICVNKKICFNAAKLLNDLTVLAN